MKRPTAFGYLRVSGRDQLDGDGFPRQSESIERWGAAAGHDIVGMFVEKAVSGRRGMVDDEVDRPAFADMVNLLSVSDSPVLVVECMDRLARNSMIQTQLIVYLRSRGITLISALTGENVTHIDPEDDPLRWAMVQIQGVISELDRNQTVRKLRIARERKRLEVGRCEGQPHYGFDENRPVESEALRIMAEHRRNGLSFSKIAKILELMHMPTRHGGKWTVSKVQRAYQHAKKEKHASVISHNG